MTGPHPPRAESPHRAASDRRPRLGLTIGDVAGVGPELIVRALAERTVREAIDPIVFGPVDVLNHAARLVEVDLPFAAVASASRAASAPGLPCVDVSPHDASAIPPATVDRRAGRIAFHALEAAARAALRGELDAIVTAPLNKRALHEAGVDAPGHTEILARLCGSSAYAMMLYVPPGDAVHGAHGLGIAHVTLHTSIASVPGLLSENRIVATIRLVEAFMRRIGASQPRVGVCALNPHAGEGGLFGDEEPRLIAPAVERARREDRIDAAGPFPADTLLARAVAGEFDGVVAMYHDQGHIAVKLMAFHRAVNVTLGLPIVRTSPAQGTAFDIAWKGIADPSGMIAAIRVAARLCASPAD